MLIAELSQVAVDVLMPNADPDLNSLFDKKRPDQLRVPIAEPDGFRRRLNASGWFDEEVLAGGLLTQGKAQSLASMMTGWALVEVLRRKRCRSLPREFCVVVTGTQVVALAMSPWSEGGGGDISSEVVVKVKSERVASWKRGEIRVEPDGRRLRTGSRGGTLHLPTGESAPVQWDGDQSMDELVQLLGS